MTSEAIVKLVLDFNEFLAEHTGVDVKIHPSSETAALLDKFAREKATKVTREQFFDENPKAAAVLSHLHVVEITQPTVDQQLALQDAGHQVGELRIGECVNGSLLFIYPDEEGELAQVFEVRMPLP